MRTLKLLFHLAFLSIITHLRIGISKTNFYLFRHNFDDKLNQFCPYNDGVQDAQHYFLFYHTYDLHGWYLLSCVNGVLLPTVLYVLQIKI